jgi:hypothetical protein
MNGESAHHPSTEKVEQLCNQSYLVAKNNNEPLSNKERQLHRLNLFLMEEVEPKIKCPIALARCQHTIGYLKAQLYEEPSHV